MDNTFMYLRNVIKLTKPVRFLRVKRFNAGLGNREDAVKALTKFKENVPAGADRETIIADMMRMSKTYRYSYDEYFLYRFAEKSDKERLKFVADLDRIDIVETMNKAINEPLFDDKSRTYAKYKRYYGRDLISCGGAQSQNKLKDFLTKHKRIFIKPADSSCGNGAQILDINKISDIEKKLREICKKAKRGLVAEEIIVQDDRMAKLHPESVNTIRITTIRLDDRIVIAPPFLKMGRKDSVVDNAGAGGIFGAIDLNTGVVTHTMDEHGRTYVTHPESNVKIIGFQIPRWNEAVALAKELAMVTPANRYTGWDLALTEKGWVLVEANARGQFICWQTATQKGYKEEISRILCELSEKKFAKVLTQMGVK